MKKARLLTLSIFLFSAAKVFAADSVEIKHFPNMKNVTLTVAQLSGTAWTQANVVSELEKANKVFAQCKLQIAEINLEPVGQSGVLTNFPEVDSVGQRLIDLKLRQPRGLALVLGRKIGFDGDLGHLLGATAGFALPTLFFDEGFDRNRDLQEGMAFVFDDVLTDYYRSRRNPNYSPLAHELSHILLNGYHVDYANLMAGANYLVNDQLTREQCATILSSPKLPKN